MRFVIASDSSVLAVAGEEIGEAASDRVIQLFRALQAAAPAWLENLHPAYTSLLIDFDPRLIDHQRVIGYVQRLPLDEHARESSKTVELEVSYDGEDLDEVARIHALTVGNLIRIHSSADYRVAFLGFMPGFAYLMGLPKEIATPRLATPRVRVPAGSVAIGGEQTGVYPAESPGGWRILGRVVNRALPLEASWVSPGDRVRFRPV